MFALAITLCCSCCLGYMIYSDQSTDILPYIINYKILLRYLGFR